MRPNNWLAGATAAAMVIALGISSEQAVAQTQESGSDIVNPFKDSATGVKISEAGVLYSDGSSSVDSSVTGEYSLKLDAGSNRNIVIADTDGSPVLTADPKGTVYADLPPGRYQVSGDGDSCQQISISSGAGQQSVSLGSSSQCDGVSANAAPAASSTSTSTASAAAAEEDDLEIIEDEAEAEAPAPTAKPSVASGSSSSSSSASASASTSTAKASRPAPKPKPKVLRFYDRDKANPPGVDIETQTSEAGVRFVTGGIGRRETAFMQSEFGNYSFMLTNTSTSDGRKAHVADVHVQIKNAAGEDVVHTKTQGPWLLAQLSPGKYTMVTHFENNSKEQSFVVGRRGQQKIDIHWPEADLGLDE